MKQNLTIVIITICLLSFFASSGNADEISYARYPALSPDGQTIAFTYMGDIWTVPSSGGDAQRLTIHEAEDIEPHFSPDGTMILFSSRRFNNWDLFIIPVEGGPPRQFTVSSAWDIGTGWFAGGDSVLFTSGREGWRDIFKISIHGGSPVKLTGYIREQEGQGRVTPDGKYLLYAHGSGLGRWWRRDLRGGRNSDLFLQDRTAGEFTSRKLTDFAEGHDVWPILNTEKNEIYFVSCRDQWAQVYKMPLEGGPAEALTDFTGDGVQWLNSNPPGTLLVFEQDFKIWMLNPETGTKSIVPISVKTDEPANLMKSKVFSGNVDYYTLSPDNKKIAAVIHGEIYVLPAEKPEEGIRITNTTARENYPCWAKDSKTLYYQSDRNDNYDIYSVDVTTGTEIQLTDNPENELKPLVSPDGMYIAFYRGLEKIIRYDLEAEKETDWITGVFTDQGIEPTIEYAWSPDSKWLGFTMSNPTYELDIHVADFNGNIHNLSRYHGWNFRPRFSDDGKLIYFTSATREYDHTYKIDLVHKPIEFFELSFDSLFIEEKDDEPDKKEKDKGDKKADEIKKTEIDFDRIETRRKRAYKLQADDIYPVLTPDCKKFLFVSSILDKPEIWSVNADDEKQDLKQLTHSGKDKKSLTVSSDNKDLYYLEGGKIFKCGIDGGEVTALSFSAAMDIDIPANNRQKFLESWQMLNSYFYDPTFHGTDWETVRTKYEPILDNIRTEREFRNLVFEMLGELRASHLYIYSREPGVVKPRETGAIGIRLDYDKLDKTGAFRIDYVMTDSPADRAGIKTGQYIRTINGTPLDRSINFNDLLKGTIGHRTIIGVSDTPSGKIDGKAVKPVPIGNEISLWYDDWVEQKRAMVDSLSGGKLAYIHIPEMSRDRLKHFIEQLVAIAEPKEGLILDVRDNGGGYIAVHLLDMLERSPYILRSFRGFPTTSENKYRSKAFERPMTLLINQYSGSNSEIFAEGFRRLELGKIIGMPTAGGVIGTSLYTLIDGTRVRRPSSGSYTLEMEDTDLVPRQPDILIDNTVDDLINGRDPQLVRAVQELMKELP